MKTEDNGHHQIQTYSVHGTDWPPHPGRTRLAAGAFLVVLIGAGAFVLGLLPRIGRNAELIANAQGVIDAVPVVSYVQPKIIKGSELVLPGAIGAIEETPIYARTTGYVKRRYVSYGSKVKAGQLLAEIEAPETEQELLQAQANAIKLEAGTGQAEADVARLRANVLQSRTETSRLEAQTAKASADEKRMEAKLAQSRALLSSAKAKLTLLEHSRDSRKADLLAAHTRLSIAEKTALRWKKLSGEGAVSEQDLDERLASRDGAEANVRSIQASLEGSEADILAARDAVAAAEADVTAAQADVASAQESIRAAQQAVGGNKASEQAAHASVVAGQKGVAAAEAAHRSSLADVRRINVMRGYERVVAPFDGVITARNVDTGTLVDAGANAGAGTASLSRNGLFGIVRTNTLRVLVSVPQSAVSVVKPGQSAKVTIREFPGRTFNAYVFGYSGAFDPTSRTRMTELRMPNPGGVLVPGMYSQVSFSVSDASAVHVSPSVLSTNASGTRVAAITSDNTIHYLPVTVGRDFGDEVEILSGLKGDEKLVLNPPISLQESTKVKAEPLPAPKKSG